jgi:hypothetical protein
MEKLSLTVLSGGDKEQFGRVQEAGAKRSRGGGRSRVDIRATMRRKRKNVEEEEGQAELVAGWRNWVGFGETPCNLDDQHLNNMA